MLPALPVIAICAIVALYKLSPKGRRHALAGIAAGAIAILSVPYWLGSSDGPAWGEQARDARESLDLPSHATDSEVMEAARKLHNTRRF